MRRIIYVRWLGGHHLDLWAHRFCRDRRAAEQSTTSDRTYHKINVRNILKQFHLTGGRRVEARWEIFNLLNRVNLGLLQSTNVRSGVFNTIASTPDVDAGNPVIAQGGPRAMQWAVKIIF